MRQHKSLKPMNQRHVAPAPDFTWQLNSQTVVVGLLAAAIVWAPLTFGASSPWARFALELTMALAVGLWALGGARPPWLTATPLLVAGSLLIQLAPLPEGLLVNVAPVSAGAWKVSAGGMSNGRSCISVDPAGTWAGIRSVLITLAAGAVVTDMCRLQKPRRVLLAALALSGVLIFLLGTIGGKVTKDFRLLRFIHVAGPIVSHYSPLVLPAQSTGVGMVEWVEVEAQRYPVDAGYIGGGVGTFLYGNHFAAAICLTLPIALSGWLWISCQRLPDWSRWLVAAAFAAAGGWAVAGLADSRAGAGALALTLATFIGLIGPQLWMRQVAGATAALLALAIAVFLMLVLLPSDTALSFVPADLKKQAAQLLADGRAEPAHVAIRAFMASPWLGTGLDSFQHVFPRFYVNRSALFYAHNELAQLLAETGLLGLGLLSLLAFFLVPKAVRFWRDAPGNYRVLNAGTWAALAGLAAHASFDWDLHLPALVLLAIVVIGLNASSVPAAKSSVMNRWPVPEYVTRWMLVGFCVVAIGGMWRDALSETVQRQLRKAIVVDRLAQKDPKRPSALDKLTRAVAIGEAFQPWDSGNARLLITLGQAELHLARQTPNGDEKSDLLGTAARWFQRARLSSAMCRGLPEPIVGGPIKPKR